MPQRPPIGDEDRATVRDEWSRICRAREVLELAPVEPAPGVVAAARGDFERLWTSTVLLGAYGTLRDALLAIGKAGGFELPIRGSGKVNDTIPALIRASKKPLHWEDWTRIKKGYKRLRQELLLRGEPLQASVAARHFRLIEDQLQRWRIVGA